MPALDSIPDKPKADESIGREFEEGIKLIATDPEQAVQLLGKVSSSPRQSCAAGGSRQSLNWV